MLTLPNGYEMVEESESAVLAHCQNKKEYVAWTKECSGGVCWGRYHSYYYNRNQEEAYRSAYQDFIDKSN